MSQQEQILTFQAITGSSEATCRKFLTSNNWNVEAAISAYFDSGSLDIAEENLVANMFHPNVPYVPEIEINDEEPVISLIDKNKASQKKTLLKRVVVLAQIVDFIAKVDVQLSFFNNNDFPIEGEFRFYQPDSTLCGFQSEINGVIKVAQIKEKEEARDVYDDAIASGKNAVLVESDDNEIGLFKTSIGNLPPNTECKIRFNYLNQLSVKDRQLQFNLPISRVPFRAENRENEYLEITCEFTMSHPILQIESNYETTSRINDSDPNLGNLVFKSHEPMFQEFQLQLRLENVYESTSITEEFTVVGDEIYNANILQSNKGKIEKSKQKLCTMINFYPEISEDEVENDSSNSEIIFILDRSGSMAGSRMNQAKNALQLFLRSLNENIYFNIVSFGDTYRKLFPTSKLYSQSTLNTAKSEVDKFDADLGGTNILDPLTDVLRTPFVNDRCPRQLFIVTDGEVSNTRKVLATIRKYSLNTRIFTFGIGADASKALVTGMAREGRGYSEFVVSGERVEPKVLSQLKKALQPVITDVSIEFTGINNQLVEQLTSQQYPKAIPPIYNGDQLNLYFYTDDRQLPNDESQLHLFGKIGKESKKWSVSIDWNRRMKDNIIHLIAASTGIREYETELYNHPDDEDMSEKCIQLSTTYGILSSLTSFVSVHGNVEATEKSMERVEFPELHLPFNMNQPQPPQGYADFHVGAIADNIAPAYAMSSSDNFYDDESEDEDDLAYGMCDYEDEKSAAPILQKLTLHSANSFSQPKAAAASFSRNEAAAKPIPQAIGGAVAPQARSSAAAPRPPPAGPVAPSPFYLPSAPPPPAAAQQFAAQPPAQPASSPSYFAPPAAPGNSPYYLSSSASSSRAYDYAPPASLSSNNSFYAEAFQQPLVMLQRDVQSTQSLSKDSIQSAPTRAMKSSSAKRKKMASPVINKSSEDKEERLKTKESGSSLFGSLISSVLSYNKASPSSEAESLDNYSYEISNALSCPLESVDDQGLEVELAELCQEEEKECAKKQEEERVERRGEERARSVEKVSRKKEERKRKEEISIKYEAEEEDDDDEGADDGKVFQRPLDHIVYLQNFDGKWRASQALAGLLKVSLNQIKLSTPNGVNLDIWCTVLCVTALRLRFADSIDEWQLLANKATKWLKNQNSNIQDQLNSLYEQASALLSK